MKARLVVALNEERSVLAYLSLPTGCTIIPLGEHSFRMNVKSWSEETVVRDFLKENSIEHKLDFSVGCGNGPYSIRYTSYHIVGVPCWNVCTLEDHDEDEL